MRTRIEGNPPVRRRRVADLRSKTEELERRLSDARASLQRELDYGVGEPGPARFHGGRRIPPRAGGEAGEAGWPAEYGPPGADGGYGGERHHSGDGRGGGYGGGNGDDGYGNASGSYGYGDSGYDSGNGNGGYGDGDGGRSTADGGGPGYGSAGYPDADSAGADYADYADADYADADYAYAGYAGAQYTGTEYEAAGYGHGTLDGCGDDGTGAGAVDYAVAYTRSGHAAAGYGSEDGGSNDRAGEYGDAEQGLLQSAEERTEVLVTKGRRSVFRPGLSRGSKTAIAVATATCVVIGVLVLLLSGSDAAWPPSVATVQKEAATACQNPNVKSEPGQVNFACSKDTSQILWVFALLTSNGNPNFTDPRTGRVGLEPITPAQGGEVAWSLNLHHPYDPASPIDSLEVAARAINNIIGGATVTGSDGKPVVQPGLESDPANCQRYTGSPALSARQGFPAVCARPVASPAGRAALVADVYRKWIVGAAPAAARDAAVLFANAQNPGDPRVQGILRHLLNSGPSA